MWANNGMVVLFHEIQTGWRCMEWKYI
jgi:hypothetical protein